MEQRLQLSKQAQKKFLEEVREESALTWRELADQYGISDRTLRDWARAKFTMSYSIAQNLSKKFSIPFPDNYKILDPLWHIPKAARLGGLKRYELHGLVGTLESRKKGGIVSQNRRKEDPEKYRLLGCNVRKDFDVPPYSAELAELVGIILGDGGITRYQLKISLSAKVDQKYAGYVSNLLFRIFKEKPYRMERNKSVIHLILSGRNLVEVLEKLGLHVGNKVKNQVGIPEWIFKKKEYQIACIRGLFDTDGSFYFHQHSKWKDTRPYFGWNFCNLSIPILHGFRDILMSVCNLEPKIAYNKQLYMYSMKNIERYIEIVGTHNPKNIKKLEYYKKIRPSVWHR